MPGTETFYVQIEGGFTLYPPPFFRSTMHAISDDHYYLGDTGEPEIRVYRPDGTPVRLLRWEAPGRALRSAVVEREKEWIRRSHDNDFSRPHIERIFREVPLPESLPAFSSFQVDSEGHLWVKEHRNSWDEGDAEWLIFAGDGRMTARIHLPDRFRPMHTGADFILGVARDEFDVEEVRLHRLDRTTAPGLHSPHE